MKYYAAALCLAGALIATGASANGAKTKRIEKVENIDDFLKGVNRGAAGLRVVGGMASASQVPGGNRLVLDDEAFDDGAVALGFSGPVEIRTVVSQGCRPIGQDMVVTKADGNVLLQPIPCFAAGTRIATLRGPVEVEALHEGDLLLTRFAPSPQPIKWIGTRRVDCRRHPRPWAVRPVKIAAGAFASDIPKRDLLLSPDHAIHMQGVLIPVKYLINDVSVVQLEASDVTYYHVELACHDVVMAEGLAVETYLDSGDRDSFANPGTVLRLYPRFGPAGPEAMLRWEAEACAPLAVRGPPVEEARRLLERPQPVRPPGVADVLPAGHHQVSPVEPQLHDHARRCAATAGPLLDRRPMGTQE